jgi:hypothetical protein
VYVIDGSRDMFTVALSWWTSTANALLHAKSED